MVTHYYLILVISLYFLLLLLWFILKQKRTTLLMVFSLLCWVLLLPVGYLSQYTVYADPFELEVINYSGRKGQLYFFRSAGCDSRILYDFAVNPNEESSLEVDRDGETFSEVIFRTEDGALLTFPTGDVTLQPLAIWEKELEPAESCYQSPIKAYRNRQQQYAIAIGLLVLGTLAMFGAAGIRK